MAQHLDNRHRVFSLPARAVEEVSATSTALMKNMGQNTRQDTETLDHDQSRATKRVKGVESSSGGEQLQETRLHQHGRLRPFGFAHTLGRRAFLTSAGILKITLLIKVVVACSSIDRLVLIQTTPVKI